MPPHRVVDQHFFKRLNIFFQRLSLRGHHVRGIFIFIQQKRRNIPLARAPLQNRLLCNIDQLSDISWPGCLQNLRRFLRLQTTNFAAIFIGEITTKLVKHQQDVISALAQGRQGHLQRIKSVKQVFAQTIPKALPHGLKIANRDNLNVSWFTLFVKKVQQLGLCRCAQQVKVFQNQAASPRQFDRWQKIILGQDRPKKAPR